MERVLAYRARLLAGGGRRLASLGDLQRVVSIASLDVSQFRHTVPPASIAGDRR